VAELAAGIDDRRLLEADLAVRTDCLSRTREALTAATRELDALRDELARCRADREAVCAERDRLAADAAVWRRDALLLDRIRRSAHRLPLYTRVGHRVVRHLVRARPPST
jgi:predicted phage gp36 major capsid-like protein